MLVVATSGIALGNAAVSTPTGDVAAGRRSTRVMVNKVTIAAGDTTPVVTVTCDPDKIYTVRVTLTGTGSYTCQGFLTTSDTDEGANDMTHSGFATALTATETDEYWSVTGVARIVLTGATNNAAAWAVIREEDA